MKMGKIDIRVPAVLQRKIGKVEKGQAVDEWRVTGTLTLIPAMPLPIPNNIPGEAWIVGEVNLLDVIIHSNPEIAEVKRIVVEGISVEGYRECAFIPGINPPTLVNEIKVESDVGDWGAPVHMGDKTWKSNSYQLDLEFSNPLRSRIKVIRHMKVDMMGTLGGSCTIASRNVILHVLYEYEGLPPPPGEVVIHVVEAKTLQPMPNVIVRIAYSDGTPVTSGQTDSSGTVRFILPKGRYVATAIKTGYDVGKAIVDSPGEATIRLTKHEEQAPLIPIPPVPPQVKPLVDGILWVGGLGLALYAGYKLIQGASIAEEVRGIVEKVRRIR